MLIPSLYTVYIVLDRAGVDEFRKVTHLIYPIAKRYDHKHRSGEYGYIEQAITEFENETTPSPKLPIRDRVEAALPGTMLQIVFYTLIIST